MIIGPAGCTEHLKVMLLHTLVLVFPEAETGVERLRYPNRAVTTTKLFQSLPHLLKNATDFKIQQQIINN